MTFSGLLEQMAAGLQGFSAQLIDLSVGSVLRAILESCASVALWLQWLVLQVLSTTRAATSIGADLDSWMADFSFPRLPGSFATGFVTFSRYTPGFATTIPVGTTVLTSDGTQSFSVVEDVSNPDWNGNGGYTLAAAQTGITLPVQCTVVGPGGNVQANTIGLLGLPINGVDIVSNAATLSGGVSAESDASFRQRFQLYINSRSLATVTAIVNAVQSVQLGLRTIVIENVNAQFTETPGEFLVVVDDGSGDPVAMLLSNVQTAVEAVRPIGSTFAVQGPAVINTSVTMVLETSNPLTHTAVTASAQAAILTWIMSLPIAGTLAISKLDAICHATDASVISVVSSLINGAETDLTAPINGVIIPTSVVVS